MKSVSTIGVTVVLWFCASAHAANERVTVSQSGTGSITATLSGEHPFCDYVFVAPPSVTVAPPMVNISSDVAQPMCPPPPVIPPPVPFTENAIVGVLPDGLYTLRWTSNPAGAFLASTQFMIQGGLLVALTGVPALSPPGVILLIAAIGLMGLATFRARPARAG